MHSKKTLYRKYPFNNILKFRPKKHSGLKLWITDIVLNSKNWKFIQKKNQRSTSTVRTITIFFLTHYFVNLKSNSTLLYNKGHNLLTSDLPTKHTQLNEMYQREFFIQITIPTWLTALIAIPHTSGLQAGQ